MFQSVVTFDGGNLHSDGTGTGLGLWRELNTEIFL